MTAVERNVFRKTCGITQPENTPKQPPALTNQALIAITKIAAKDAK